MTQSVSHACGATAADLTGDDAARLPALALAALVEHDRSGARTVPVAELVAAAASAAPARTLVRG